MRWLALLCFGGIGLAALAGGAVWGLQRFALFQGGRHARGRVVANKEVTGTQPSDNDSRYEQSYVVFYPVVEFRTEEGRTVRFEGVTGGAKMDEGTEVDVLYDPGDPAAARIGGFSQFWLGPAVAVGAGAVFLLMGVGTFFLVGAQERQMAASFAAMRRQALMMRRDVPVVQGTVVGVEPLSGPGRGFVLVCRATRPGGGWDEEFRSDFLDFDPGSRPVGRTVDVYLDPDNRDNYYVHIDPLLPELVGRRTP